MGTGVAIIWGEYKIIEKFKKPALQENFENVSLCCQTSPYLKVGLKVAVEFCSQKCNVRCKNWVQVPQMVWLFGRNIHFIYLVYKLHLFQEGWKRTSMTLL